MFVSDSIVGRYAPSPTGALHMGNIRTALLAWLHARIQGGRFLLRMEDLDTPRVVAGSAAGIIADLKWLGLDWDGPIVYQSQRTSLYQNALELLTKQGLIYPCFCSRKEVQESASKHQRQQGVYPGTCRTLGEAEIKVRSQLKSPAYRIRVSSALAKTCGDFVVKRSDGLFAYQLAVVVDDLAQGVTQIIRGYDLADCVDKQQYLASVLAPQHPPITYLHAPLMVDSNGQKLSKRDGSDSLAAAREQGVSASALLAKLLHELQLVDSSEDIALKHVLDTISLTTLEQILR